MELTYKRLVILMAAPLVVGCNERPSPTDLSPQLAISDGAHAGNEHFYFLPPMVPNASPTGTFDGSLAPEVKICEWTGSGCVSPFLAEFTTTTGPGSETVRVNDLDEYYIVNWHTDEFNVAPAPTTYRISVLVAAGTELGFADVQLGGTGKEAKNLATGDIIGLKDGRTLPIKFRIEEGALVPAGPPATVFVNFDGVTLVRSTTTDDATTNVSFLVQSSPTVIPAFSPAELSNDGGLTRVEIISATVAQLEAIHAPYNIAFTTTRPVSGSYSMLVFGGLCSSVIGQAGCAGIALQDCGNTFPSNISFVFPPGLRVEDLAVVAARQNAIALGLDNTDNPDDVMFPVLQVTPPERFAAGNTLGGGCLAPGTFQDSHQRMLDVLGAS